MNIKWNEVTWYSKLLSAIFLLLVVPILTFYIGTQYQETIRSIPSIAILPVTSHEPIPSFPENNSCIYSHLPDDGTGDDPSIDYSQSGWCRYSISESGPIFVFHLMPNPGIITQYENNYFPSIEVLKTDGTPVQTIALSDEGLLGGNQPNFFDANFDGFSDISVPREQAQCSTNSFFFYNPKTGMFESDPALGLDEITNASFDDQTKTISGFCSSSAAEGGSAKFKIENGKLITIETSVRACTAGGASTDVQCITTTKELDASGNLVETSRINK